jgi:integrase/recombinase XerD
MHIHTFQRDDGQKRYLLLDEDEVVVALPTSFANSCASKPRYSNRTPEEYLKVLMYFCEYLRTCYFGRKATLDELIATIGPAPIEEWFIQQRDKGAKGSTLRFRDAVLKMFMDWLTTQEAGQIRRPTDNPYTDGNLKTAAPPRLPAKYLTCEEVTVFIQQGFLNESERCLAHFLFDTGLRVSEVARVRHAHLPNIQNFPANVMYFPLCVYGSKGRGGLLKKRFTIISRTVLERLQQLHSNWRVYLRAQVKYKPEEIPVFLNLLGQPITALAIQKQFQIASQRLSKHEGIRKKISPHCLRHGTAFSILKSEHGREFLENLVVCQRALGHNSIKTTELYTMIPAPVIARIQEQNSPQAARERYREAEYIYEHTFKPQRSHQEHRGHGRQSYLKNR